VRALDHEREAVRAGEDADRGGALVGDAREAEVVHEERGESLNVVSLKIEMIEMHELAGPACRLSIEMSVASVA
jgi:hypothetical protein